MTPVLDWALPLALFMLALAMGCALIRLLKGPSAQDRVLALDCMYLNGMLVMLVLFEWVIPWFRQGRTLGGSYTHMTCETTPRSGARRVAFYAARFAAICCVVFCGRVPWAGAVILVMGVFWLVRRQMPYDLI